LCKALIGYSRCRIFPLYSLARLIGYDGGMVKLLYEIIGFTVLLAVLYFGTYKIAGTRTDQQYNTTFIQFSHHWELTVFYPAVRLEAALRHKTTFFVIGGYDKWAVRDIESFGPHAGRLITQDHAEGVIRMQAIGK
jgi:hypothetical protein